MFKRITLFLFMAFMSAVSYSQQYVPEDIPTPNASDLGRYGNIPVSYYTGKPNISIPLYSTKLRGKDFNITLDYDASGVMINSLPSWTGHNWTLNVGGVITRTIYNVPDELVPARKSSILPFDNYFSSYGKILEDMKDEEKLKHDVEYHRYDFMPDVFNFNFMGKTGQFFLGNDGQWKVKCDENIDIVFDVKEDSNYISPFIENYPGDMTTTKQPKVIKGFTIRDSQGYCYIFGGDNNSIEYSVNFFNQTSLERTSPFYANSWFLTKVTDKFGNVIYKLDYERGAFIAQFYNSFYEQYIREYNSKTLKYGQEILGNNSKFPYGGILNSPVYLKEITLANQLKICFNSSYSPVKTEDMYPYLNVNKFFQDVVSNEPFDYFWYLQTNNDKVKKYQYRDKTTNSIAQPLSVTRLKVLNSIKIDYNRRIDFNYDYNSRMHLTSISLCQNASETGSLGEYKLRYSNYDLLPKNYLTTAADHWGYYNGTEFASNDKNALIKRNPNANFASYGQLKEIIYPTGGKSVFNYELNDYSSCVSLDRSHMENKAGMAGGMRIKSITDYADTKETSIVNQHTFSYIDPKTGKSSGELFATPCYSWSNWMADIKYKNAYSLQSVYRTSSIIPLANSFGPHIGYSYVKETSMDGSYKCYRYNNISSAMDERFILDYSKHEPSPFDMFTERGYKRGKLLLSEQYDTQGQIAQRCKYGYRKDNAEKDSVLSCNLGYVNWGSSATFSYFTGGVYKLLCPKYDVVEDTISTYYGNNSVTDTHQYNMFDCKLFMGLPYSHYSTLRLLSSKTTKRNDFEIKEQYTYPFNNPIVVNLLLCYRFDLTPIEKKLYRNNIFVSGLRTQYGGGSKALNGRGDVPAAELRYNYDNTVDTIVNYLSYTPTSALCKYKMRGKPTTAITYQGNDCYVTSIIEGTILETPIYDEENTLKKSYYWNYILNKVEEMAMPNGYTTYYEYDGLGRLTESSDSWFKLLSRNRYNIVK